MRRIKPGCWRSRVDGLPVWLRRALADPPLRGEGLHAWLFSTARQLHAHFALEEMCDLFADITEADEREIEDAVYNSISCAWLPKRRSRFQRGAERRGSVLEDARHYAEHSGRAIVKEGQPQAPGTRPMSGPPAQPKWPQPDLAKIEAIVTTGPRLADLCRRSPYIFTAEDPNRYTGWILRKLFVTADDPDPYICFGLSQREFGTARLSKWGRNLWELQFIVPSPMISEMGWTKAGYLSAHTLDNTGPRRFLVNECDFSILTHDGTTETQYAQLIRRLAERGISVADMCASILLHLAEYLPLVMALSSGGKSEHGWFLVQGLPEADLRLFMEYAVSLGVDHATWIRSQFVRLANAVWAAKNRRRGEMRLYACIQAWDEGSAAECAGELAQHPFDGFAIGGLVPRARDWNSIAGISLDNEAGVARGGSALQGIMRGQQCHHLQDAVIAETPVAGEVRHGEERTFLDGVDILAGVVEPDNVAEPGIRNLGHLHQCAFEILDEHRWMSRVKIVEVLLHTESPSCGYQLHSFEQIPFRGQLVEYIDVRIDRPIQFQVPSVQCSPDSRCDVYSKSIRIELRSVRGNVLVFRLPEDLE